MFDIRIETVFVRVSDIEKATKWYKAVLNTEIKWEKEYITALQLGESDLTLVQQELENLNDVTYNLVVKDIELFKGHLESLNIKVSKVKKWHNIRYISFCDLDNNKIEVIQKI